MKRDLANLTSENDRTLKRGWLLPIAAGILLMSLWIPGSALAGKDAKQVCDVTADYFLGIENDAEAIRVHRTVLSKHPENALAHYHLGFAQAMVNNRTAELTEYQQAATLGLRNWDLFLNMGLAQLENGDLDAAIDSLRKAVLFGGDHSESHFDLALAYARRGILSDAEHEMRESLWLDPGKPDARNMLGVIYIQEGKTALALVVWREIVRENFTLGVESNDCSLAA